MNNSKDILNRLGITDSFENSEIEIILLSLKNQFHRQKIIYRGSDKFNIRDLYKDMIAGRPKAYELIYNMENITIPSLQFLYDNKEIFFNHTRDMFLNVIMKSIKRKARHLYTNYGFKDLMNSGKSSELLQLLDKEVKQDEYYTKFKTLIIDCWYYEQVLDNKIPFGPEYLDSLKDYLDENNTYSIINKIMNVQFELIEKPSVVPNSLLEEFMRIYFNDMSVLAEYK